MRKKNNKKTLEERLGQYLTKAHLTLSIAESCTGGMLSNKITNTAGSSNYFIMAIISYSNESKIKFLDVPKDIIKKYGAVSKETAKYMAEGIRKKAKTEIGLSITGIAGPEGGTLSKPVGLIFIGVSLKGKNTIVRKCYFKGKRIKIKEKAAIYSLKLLLDLLKNI